MAKNPKPPKGKVPPIGKSRAQVRANEGKRPKVFGKKKK